MLLKKSIKTKTSLCFLFFFLILITCLLQKIYRYEDHNPTVIIENNSLNLQQNIELLKGNKIFGEFKAKHNNLGIISIPFDTHYRINDDYLIFRIKNKNQANWFYENKYKVDQFQNKKYFPFGFPEIKNSKNETYQIEIESVQGSDDNFVSVNKYSQILSKYSYPKTYLLENKKELIPFLINKSTSFFRHLTINNLLFVFILPVLLYFFLNYPATGKYLNIVLNNFPKNKVVSQNEKIFSWFLIQLLLVLFLSAILIIKYKHNEGSEWKIYEFGSIIVFLTLIFLNYKNKISLSFHKKILIATSLALITGIIILSFFMEIISMRYLTLLALGFITPIIFDRFTPYLFIRNILINSLIIFFISGYFILDIDAFSNSQFIALLLATISIFFISLNYQNFISKIQKIDLFRSKIITTILFLFIFLSTYSYISKKPIEFHHYSFYIGPVYELSLGKSILVNSLSQYGYLSIHFIKTVISQFGISFESFHLFNAITFTIYFAFIFFIFYKITRNLFLSFLLYILSVFFQTVFSLDSTALAPSTGPLRFGLSVLLILSLLYINNQKNKLIVSSLIASLSLFWSVETAIYIVPAFIYYLLSNNFTDKKNLRGLFLNTLKDTKFFFAFTILFFLTIVNKEYLHTGTFPLITNYFQFVNAYKSGFGSELIPLLGNYYLVVAVLLLGITLSVFLTFSNNRNKLTSVLNFISIHNIALFSYFISRSNQNNVVNISIFILVELIISYKLISTILIKDNQNNIFIKHTLIPSSFFLLTFFLVSIMNILHPERLHYPKETVSRCLKDYGSLQSKYHFNQNNILIVSKDCDSPIILANKINTKLPLNPSLMTVLLPDYELKYINPYLKNIEVGTTMITSDDMPELLGIINKNFKLTEIDPKTDKGIFKLFILN